MRGMAKFGLVFTLFAAGACVPSRETRSAGQVGCAPDEITISDEETHFGLLQSGETWTVECRGRTFFCSQMNPSGERNDGLTGLFASQQISCAESAESPEEERKRRSLEAKVQSAAPKPPTTPPVGAAGFAFGQTPSEGQQRCEQAGHQWRLVEDTAATCSGAAAELGFPASVGVRFCGGQACAISVQHQPNADWAERVVTLKAQLEAKYGTPHETPGPIPERCRSAQDFTQCLQSNTLTLRYGWRWTGGEGVELLVGKPSAEAPAQIRLQYKRAPLAANVSAL
jgi:hypothetical protein